MGMVKGVRCVNARAFVEKRFGKEAWQDLRLTLAREDAASLEAVTPAGWYDAGLHGRLVRTLCDHFGAPGDLGLAAELGRFEAESDLTTTQRWFLRLIPPWFAIRNMDIYWSRFQDTGHWESEVEGRRIVARLLDWCVVEPALCRFLQGYLGRTLEFFGAGEGIIGHPRCRSEGHPFCEFSTLRPTIEDWAWRSGSPVPPEDMPQLVYELSHLSDLDLLLDAIVDVLRNRFSFSFVAVWVRARRVEALERARASGASGVAPHHSFVLQVGGKTVGRIDAEAARVRDPASMDQLMSCFAVALGKLLLDSTSPTVSSEEVPACVSRQRVEAAVQRWRLTPRQKEVLLLLIRGSTNKEIARALGCEEGTVESHVSQMLKRGRLPNRAALVYRVLSDL